eukprot:10593237-Karenia_brevis.AAC.1
MDRNQLINAVKGAQNSITTSNGRAALWSRMTRGMKHRNCPPLLREKWMKISTGDGIDRKEQNRTFDVFLSCGGDLGKMAAAESIMLNNKTKQTRTKGMYTLAQLIHELHMPEEKAPHMH